MTIIIIVCEQCEHFSIMSNNRSFYLYNFKFQLRIIYNNKKNNKKL